MKLITILPDVVKSPKLTADWENALTLVASYTKDGKEITGSQYKVRLEFPKSQKN